MSRPRVVGAAPSDLDPGEYFDPLWIGVCRIVGVDPFVARPEDLQVFGPEGYPGPYLLRPGTIVPRIEED